ncbi:nucleoside hydrolase [Nonomuraea angiospora]|uniref:nucleoside hydrolase n=1 Tax=Nonomuraea angiospora TaxID=46172 RepID=UPI0029B1B524|nr:nucleoside hydrolase [Nonomuraea angiospora]MDX3107935.1 nucleoside hydrolase [Nonomuraea angiospora]
MEDAITANEAPVVVDTDGGVDDLVALWLLATHPAIDLRGVIATGISRPARIVARNVLLLFEALDRDIPVVIGADRPVDPAPVVAAAAMHGPEGLGDLQAWRPRAEPATLTPGELLGETSRTGPVRMLSLGPLSTLASLLDSGAVADLTVMGGSIRAGGNALPAAEANIARDPGAAARVVAHPWTVPTRLVGLDATKHATLTHAEVALFGDSVPAGPIMRKLLRHYGAHASDPDCFPCHDLFAAAVLVDPGVATFEHLPLSVDTGGSAAWGMTVADSRPPLPGRSLSDWRRWAVATGVDLDRYRELLHGAVSAL